MDSSDSDDCLITNFVKAKDQIYIIDDEETVVKKFKKEQQNSEDEVAEDLELVIVPGDGHCISHCFSKHFNQPLKNVLNCLQNEFSDNIKHYQEFSLLSRGEILQEVKEYINFKKYNNATADMFLHAFSRAFSVNVKVFQDDSFLFIDGGFNKLINLEKRGDHYNLYRSRNKEDHSSNTHEIESDDNPDGDGDGEGDSNGDCNGNNVGNRSGDRDSDGDEVGDGFLDHDNFVIEEGENSLSKCADDLFRILILDYAKYQEKDALKGVRCNKMYTILKSSFDDVCADDNGAYKASRTTKQHYYLNIDRLKHTIKSKGVHLYNGHFYYNARGTGNAYERVAVDKSDVWTLYRYYRKSKSIPGLQRMVAKIKAYDNELYEPHICVIYSKAKDSTAKAVEYEIQSHGNSKAQIRPYIRTTKSTLLKQRELLKQNSDNVSAVYDQVLQESGGPYESSSQSKEPRDKKQLYNQSYNLSKSRIETKEQKSDEVMELIAEQRKNKMIQSIVVKENAYFFFMCTSRQIEDIVSFCCVDNNIEVLGIDTTFNLCDLWITDTCYKNKRLVNIRTGNNPVFLGPLIFHFTKDEDTFTRLAVEMIAMNQVIMSKLRKVGVDMEDAIFNGIKKVIPNVSPLYCVRHLSQRDEIKINQLLGKTKSTVSANNKARAEIIKDIYGERKGLVYEYGLAEAEDIEDFNQKLTNLKEKWESLCPDFYQWFVVNRKKKFEESVICSARERTSISGMFYQNDIESLHFIEKRNQCFQKKTVSEAAEALKALALRQENDEVRAVYGAGNYTLSKEFSKFKVDSARWHSWSEIRRRDHIQKFREYKPTTTDSFIKPKNSGRKASFQKRKRNEEPVIVVDRIEEHSLDVGNDQEEGARFLDPREKQVKQFEIYFRNSLPRSIKRCHGMCGKVINPEDDGLLVRTYGKTTWTDKSTGAERSKFGPMYVHFNQKCLENSDSENFYGPSKSFDYSRIKIDDKTKEKLNKTEKVLLKSLGMSL